LILRNASTAGEFFDAFGFSDARCDARRNQDLGSQQSGPEPRKMNIRYSFFAKAILSAISAIKPCVNATVGASPPAKPHIGQQKGHFAPAFKILKLNIL
jgi:hypothetical protein